jgi:hypothetical protein
MLWIIGGYGGSYLNDSWFSADRINWILDNNTVFDQGVQNHAASLKDGNLLIIGGKTADSN